MELRLFKDPDKSVKSLIKKLTHSGEDELNTISLKELKEILKTSSDTITVEVFKCCMRCLAKPHAQVRVATVKLLNHLFHKSHIIRTKLLDEFDRFLELTLAVSQEPKIKLKLPPPKKHAALLQELSAKCIHAWHADYSKGYEKLRYIYRFLREHGLVDFSHFRVQTHQDLINRRKEEERLERILERNIRNRLQEFQDLKPQLESVMVQIESLLDLLVPDSGNLFVPTEDTDDDRGELSNQHAHGIANLSSEIEISINPFVELTKNEDNKETVQNLRELKRDLLEFKLTKLIAIEKTISKRGELFVNVLKEIIDYKNRATNLVMKLSELQIVNDIDGQGAKSKSRNLDCNDSDDDDDDFQDVQEKEDLETYIPKNMRYEYGLCEAINPKELNSSGGSQLIDESFDLDQPIAGPSGLNGSKLAIACNVRLESGKLCPRRDKLKCPFHGRIIPRDHNGIPLDDEVRLEEEKQATKTRSNVPDWQDPELLQDIRLATGIDLTMPTPGKRATKKKPKSNLVNTRTCDTTPKQRLQKRLKLLGR